MLKCSTSLWSADLSNLESEIKRVEPYSERFHLDVADGHYVKNLLFFPDLVKALRKRITRTARLMALFWYCPEFPDKPYLTIPIAERQRRLRTLWPGPASAAITLKPKIIPPDIGQRLARERLFYGSLELAFFEIEWMESDTFLAHAFSQWPRCS